MPQRRRGYVRVSGLVLLCWVFYADHASLCPPYCECWSLSRFWCGCASDSDAACAVVIVMVLVVVVVVVIVVVVVVVAFVVVLLRVRRVIRS